MLPAIYRTDEFREVFRLGEGSSFVPSQLFCSPFPSHRPLAIVAFPTMADPLPAVWEPSKEELLAIPDRDGAKSAVEGLLRRSTRLTKQTDFFRPPNSASKSLKSSDSNTITSHRPTNGTAPQHRRGSTGRTSGSRPQRPKASDISEKRVRYLPRLNFDRPALLGWLREA